MNGYKVYFHKSAGAQVVGNVIHNIECFLKISATSFNEAEEILKTQIPDAEVERIELLSMPDVRNIPIFLDPYYGPYYTPEVTNDF